MRSDAAELAGEELHAGDKHQQEDLAVEVWAFEVARDPAIDAEVDERGEGPDVFDFDDAAEDAGGETDDDVEGEAEELAVQQCRDC